MAVFKRKHRQKLYKDREGNPATLRHVRLQAAIRVEADHAWTRSLWVEMANDGPNGALKMGTFGIYEDELQRVKGHWLFSKRRVLQQDFSNWPAFRARTIRCAISTEWPRRFWRRRNRVCIGGGV